MSKDREIARSPLAPVKQGNVERPKKPDPLKRWGNKPRFEEGPNAQAAKFYRQKRGT